jgi:hypothetical protein
LESVPAVPDSPLLQWTRLPESPPLDVGSSGGMTVNVLVLAMCVLVRPLFLSALCFVR